MGLFTMLDRKKVYEEAYRKARQEERRNKLSELDPNMKLKDYLDQTYESAEKE